MNRLSPLTSASSVQPHPLNAAPAPIPGAAPVPPADSFTPSSAGARTSAPLDQATIDRLLLGKGPGCSLDSFFSTDHIECVQRVPADRKAGCTGWKISSRYAPYNEYCRREYTLDDNVPDGWTSAWGGPYSANALGCWTRRGDAWESSRVVAFADPKSEIQAAMLTTRLGDDGRADMVLWERLRGGGAIFRRLDADKWLKHPEVTPDALEVVVVNPGDDEKASFYQPSQAPNGPPMFRQFFGPHNAKVVIETLTPSDNKIRSGASVDLTYDWGWMRQVHLALFRDEKSGKVESSHGMEDQLFLNWVRTDTGWRNETHARITPEQFSRFKDVTLRTDITEDGKLTSMRLIGEGWRGETEETVLDAAEWFAGRAAAPTIVDVRHTEPIVSPSAPPLPDAPQKSGPGSVRDEGDYIVIGGVRVDKRRSSFP